MDTKEKIESFRKKITERVFEEYTRYRTVVSRVYILGFHETDGWVVGHKRIPDILHLEGDEFDKGFLLNLKKTDRFIRRFEEDGHQALCVSQTEGGFDEGEDCDNISITFRTGRKLNKTDVLNYRVDCDPVSVNEEGVMVETPPRFTKVEWPWTDQ